MSYCRFGEQGSDVYLYAAGGGDHFACCSCTLAERWPIKSPMAAIRHLEEHVLVGDRVPDRAFALLLADTEHGPPWTNGVAEKLGLTNAEAAAQLAGGVSVVESPHGIQNRSLRG